MGTTKAQREQEYHKLNVGIILWIIAAVFLIVANIFYNTTNWFGWVLSILEIISIILVCQKRKSGRMLVIISHAILGVIYLIVAFAQPVSWDTSKAIVHQAVMTGQDWEVLMAQYKTYMSVSSAVMGGGFGIFALYFGVSNKVKKILSE